MNRAALLLTLVVFASACVSSQGVQKGDLVAVDYVGRLTDGTLFDTNVEDVARSGGIYSEMRSYQPLRFEVGAGQMIEGFDNAVVGMKEGEKKTVNIPPEQGYGERDERKVGRFPTEAFTDNNITPEAGKTYPTALGFAKVVSVSEEGIILDYNHELAGETLVFEINLREITKPSG